WLPAVQGNHNHLVRLFQNLLSNALKYRSLRAVKIHVTAARRGSDWLIQIKDNGVGIAPENQDRIFSPFTRLVNHEIPGTGLGLAVCKQILEGMSGSIWVESELGVGTTFCFTIPGEPKGRLIPMIAQGASASEHVLPARKNQR
ncbi:MAG: ATP-binding protein, partial [Terriglobales bacterium]